jgi:hypothetical protein
VPRLMQGVTNPFHLYLFIYFEHVLIRLGIVSQKLSSISKDFILNRFDERGIVKFHVHCRKSQQLVLGCS